MAKAEKELWPVCQLSCSLNEAVHLRSASSSVQTRMLSSAWHKKANGPERRKSLTFSLELVLKFVLPWQSKSAWMLSLAVSFATWQADHEVLYRENAGLRSQGLSVPASRPKALLVCGVSAVAHVD